METYLVEFPGDLILKLLKCLEVLISCPSDMQTHADSVFEQVQEFNDIFGYDRGVIFRTINWKKNVVGEVANDAQVAINDQIVERSDLLVALIGERLGTPTNRAVSGTAEEIEIFLSRDGRQFSNRHVQIIFKNKVEIDFNSADFSELQRVRDFRTRMQTKALVAEFSGDRELEGIVRRFLESALNLALKEDGSGDDERDFVTVAPSFGASMTPTVADTPPHIMDEEDPTIFDEIEGITNAATLQSALFERYSVIINGLTAKLNERNTRSVNTPLDAKRYYDEIGGILDDAADDIAPIAEEMSDALKKFTDSFENLLLLISDMPEGDRDQVRAMLPSLTEAEKSINDFLAALQDGDRTIAGLPRTTSRFSSGRKKFRNATSVTVDVIKVTSNRFSEYIAYIKRYL